MKQLCIFFLFLTNFMSLFSSFLQSFKYQCILGSIAWETTAHRATDDRAGFGSWGFAESSAAISEEYKWGKYIQWYNLSTANGNTTSIRCPDSITTDLETNNTGRTITFTSAGRCIAGGNKKESLVLRQKEVLLPERFLNRSMIGWLVDRLVKSSAM